MKLLYDALFSINPTSTDIERIFSSDGEFVKKIRNELSDKAIEAFVFLKLCFIGIFYDIVGLKFKKLQLQILVDYRKVVKA